MLGMDFIEMYNENPNAAVAFIIFAVLVVILYYSIAAYSKSKEKKRMLQERALEEQFKRKHNIK